MILNFKNYVIETDFSYYLYRWVFLFSVCLSEWDPPDSIEITFRFLFFELSISWMSRKYIAELDKMIEDFGKYEYE